MTRTRSVVLSESETQDPSNNFHTGMVFRSGSSQDLRGVHRIFNNKPKQQSANNNINQQNQHHSRSSPLIQSLSHSSSASLSSDCSCFSSKSNKRDFVILDYEDDTSEDVSTEPSPRKTLSRLHADSRSASSSLSVSALNTQQLTNTNTTATATCISLSQQNQLNYLNNQQLLCCSESSSLQSLHNLDKINHANFGQVNRLTSQSLEVMPPENNKRRIDLSDCNQPENCHNYPIILERIQNSLCSFPLERGKTVSPLTIENKNRVETKAEEKASRWLELPNYIFYQICENLPISDAVTLVSSTKFWHNRHHKNNYLWRKLYYRDMKGRPGKFLNDPMETSFLESFKKVYERTPKITTNILNDCKDEVLHVSFSPDGRFLAVCAKDAIFRVYNGEPPYNLLYRNNIGRGGEIIFCTGQKYFSHK